MSKKTNPNTNETGFESVEHALSRTEQYIEDNKNTLLTIVAVVFVLIGIYMGFKKLFLEPREDEARSEMFTAERYFEQDSFRLALEGDGEYLGFVDIIDDFGITKSANLAKYYAGISSLRLGEYDEAIDYLKSFNGKDKLVSVIATGSIGDAYVELGEYDKAVSYFLDAADANPNDLTSGLYLKKAGLAYEELGKYTKAREAYEKIKYDFPNSEEAREIDKYISAVKAKE